MQVRESKYYNYQSRCYNSHMDHFAARSLHAVFDVFRSTFK
jgi:hypothetical protein